RHNAWTNRHIDVPATARLDKEMLRSTLPYWAAAPRHHDKTAKDSTCRRTAPRRAHRRSVRPEREQARYCASSEVHHRAAPKYQTRNASRTARPGPQNTVARNKTAARGCLATGDSPLHRPLNGQPDTRTAPASPPGFFPAPIGHRLPRVSGPPSSESTERNDASRPKARLYVPCATALARRTRNTWNEHVLPDCAPRPPRSRCAIAGPGSGYRAPHVSRKNSCSRPQWRPPNAAFPGSSN